MNCVTITGTREDEWFKGIEIAPAVGEGSMAISFVHKHLIEV